MCLIFISPTVSAAPQAFPSPNKVLEILQNAFAAQVSLSMEYRTYEEVKEVLTPYFSDEYAERFLHDNLVEHENRFIILGSDSANYFIPFFTYSDETKVVYDQNENKIYVYEYFEEVLEGPVTYDSHYETITFEKENDRWVVKNLTISDNLEKKIEETTTTIHMEVIETVRASKTYESKKNEKEIPLPTYQISGMSYKEQLYSGAIKGTY